MISNNMSKSSDILKLGNLYLEILHEDMTSAVAYGGDIAGHVGIEATDWYAPGDSRNPYGLGITTRNGSLKRKKGKKRRKKRVQK
jgi:hypothetical protein